MNIKVVAVAIAAATTLFCASKTYASNPDSLAKGKNKFGYSIGIESNSIYYWNDTKTGAEAPPDNFASNNYLKADFSYGKFSAGFQGEAYLPNALIGYPEQYDHSKIAFKYIAFETNGLKITAGDFYTQFGSGLLLRAWEDRTLGLNTSIEGGNVSYQLSDLFTITGLYGRQRYFMSYADSWLAGADMSFSLSSLFKWGETNLAVEGSFLNKREDVTNVGSFSTNESVNGYSARVVFDISGFTSKAEFVGFGSDPSSENGFSEKKGKAALIELGYSTKGLGMAVSLRKLSNMNIQEQHSEPSIFTQVNYLPSLTRQYTYSLAMMNPYPTQDKNEYGGQYDLFYNFARASKIGGKYGMKLHFNFSAWAGDEGDGIFQPKTEDVLMFADMSIDVEKKFSNKVSAKFLFAMQRYNPKLQGNMNDPDWNSFIVVADVTTMLGAGRAIRLEAQHLSMKYDKGNWAAITAEYSIAPRWSFFVADMLNYGDTDIHYYNVGASYTRNALRVGLNVGRFKEGYQCAGGVCRLIPAYSGVGLNVSYQF